MSERSSKQTMFKRSPLAVAVALALGAPAAFAAAPAANQLPGNGAVTSGSSTVSGPTNVPSSGPETITVTGNGVIRWGDSSKTATINTKQPGGFNIGSKATLQFKNGHTATGTNTPAKSAVLNIDASGNPSQILGTLNDGTSGVDIFVANGNGIIVGSTAKISSTGGVGLIGESGNALQGQQGGFTQGTVNDGLTFDGKSGGDVTVAKGASISGSTILVAGGSNVNVDLGALTSGSATLMAGENNTGSTSGFASTNKNAVLTVSGQLPSSGDTVTDFESAGNAVNNGTLDLGSLSTTVSPATLAVGGTFTNTGDLTLASGTSSLNVVNTGKLTTSKSGTSGGDFASLTNKGTYNSNGPITVTGGDLSNVGQIDAGTTAGGATTPYAISVNNGSIVNSGTMKNVTALSTAAVSADAGYNSSADYSISNSGTISGLTGSIDANFGASDKTTGSFTNTGVLSLGYASGGAPLNVEANNDVNLGGQVEQPTASGKSATAVSTSNPLTSIALTADNGKLTVAAPLAFIGSNGATGGTSGTAGTAGTAFLTGQQVSVMSNLSGVASTASTTPTGVVTISAGAKPTSGYAVRVASGKTVSANAVDVVGQADSAMTSGYDNPNVILQGTLSGNVIQLGGDLDGSGAVTTFNQTSGGTSSPVTMVNGGSVSDVFSGPNGGLNGVSSTSGSTTTNAAVDMNFTGAVKNAKYTNSSNFRYNYLPITSDGTVDLTLNPVDYKTNGTTGVSSSGNPSAVNVLVNNDVNVTSFQQPSSVPDSSGSSVAGINNWPNTHLVLQSTGNISLKSQAEAAAAGNSTFYWPGLVYLGTIDTVNGQAAPGTLSGFGTISADGEVNNVLPGSSAAGGGIHFETALPLSLAGNDVVTNANSWVNFGNDTLTNHYASANASSTVFYGGSQGTGNVVDYNALPAADFHTQAPVSTK